MMKNIDPNIEELMQMYVFTTAVNEKLLDQLQPSHNTIEFAELLGMAVSVGQEAAKLSMRVTLLRTSHPAVYDAWVSAVKAARADMVSGTLSD